MLKLTACVLVPSSVNIDIGMLTSEMLQFFGNPQERSPQPIH
jgi:hypothetical protein